MSSGLTVAELLERLRPQSRGKGRLTAAKPRTKIGESVATAYPSAAPNGGIRSPLTEDSRTYYTTSATLVSSNGFFVLEYYPTESITFLDDSQQEIIVNYTNTAE
jgi:hypothetical protein